MRRSLLWFCLVLALALPVPVAGRAQESAATPGSSASGECVAPALPPGTVTPPQESSTDPAADDEATPAPTPIPEGVPADQATIDRFTAAEANIINCLNAGNYLAAAALFSPDGLLFFFGSDNPYDAAASLDGYPPMTIRGIDNVETLPDDRIRGEITYTVGWQLTGGVEYWVEHDGILKLDFFTDLPAPIEAPAGAPVVELRMIDYAFALSQYTAPAAEVIVFRATIDSASGSDHVAILAGCPAGTTTEQLILGTVDFAAVCTDLYGQLYLRPRQEGAHDMILYGLPPGRYFFVCDVPTASATSHHRLGMVAEIVLE